MTPYRAWFHLSHLDPSTPHRLYQLSNASDKAQRMKDHSDGGVAKRNPSFGRLPLESPFGRQNLVTMTYTVALWGFLAFLINTFEGLRYAPNPSL